MKNNELSGAKIGKDILDIKEWAKLKDQELRAQIDYYIKEGIDKRTAVNMVLESSTLGAGYNGQIRYDYLGFQMPEVQKVKLEGRF